MPDLVVINDLNGISLSDDATAGATSQVQIAKTGVFRDPRYGKFSITQADFDKWIKNFNTLSKADGRLGIPVDVDHSPEKQGTTEAAGWVTALSKKGDQLWATVEWNDLGVELVRNKRYAYLSPSYQNNLADETGKTHGTALVGVGLTNRPFLSMATISLSADWTFAVETEEDRGDSQSVMPDFTNIATKIGLASDADETAILSKVTELLARPEKAPETVDLAAAAAAEGQVLLSQDRLTALAADAKAGVEAKQELHTMKFLNAFNTMVEDGRGVPAQQEHYRKVFDLDADTGIAMMASAPKILNTELKGSGAQTTSLARSVNREAEGAHVDEDRLALHERATVLSAEHNIDYSDAVIMAADEMGA